MGEAQQSSLLFGQPPLTFQVSTHEVRLVSCSFLPWVQKVSSFVLCMRKRGKSENKIKCHQKLHPALKDEPCHRSMFRRYFQQTINPQPNLRLRMGIPMLELLEGLKELKGIATPQEEQQISTNKTHTQPQSSLNQQPTNTHGKIS